MTYRKLGIKTRRYRVVWVALLTALVIVLPFRFYDPLLDYLVDEPDYSRAFLYELGREYHRVTKFSVILAENTAGTSENDLVYNYFIEDKKKFQENEINNHLELIANTNTNANSNTKEKKRFTAKDLRTTIREHPGVTRFKIEDSGFLSILHMTYAPLKPNIPIPEDFTSLAIPKNNEMAFGLFLQQKPLPAEHSTISISDLPLQNLHWRSGGSIDFSHFNERMSLTLAIKDSGIKDFVNDDLLARMRARVARDYRLTEITVRLLLFPVTLMAFTLWTMLCWFWYRDYLREFNVWMMPPGFIRMFFSRDLMSLTKAAKHKLANMKMEELKARAKKTVKLDPTKVQTTPKPSRFRRSEPVLVNTDPRQLQQQKVAQLVRDFQILSEESENGNGTAAWQIFQQALVTEDLGRQRDLLAQSIAELKKSNSKPERYVNVEKKTPDKVLSPEVYIKLQNRLDELFPVPDFLPSKVDGRMVREFLVVLLKPGKDVNIFNDNYMPDDAVRRSVAQRYKVLNLEFCHKTFTRTRDWLIKYGVVISKQKTAAITCSLASKISNGKSEEAQALIKLVKHVNASLTTI